MGSASVTLYAKWTQNPNGAPQITGTYATDYYRYEKIEFTIQASDPDGDPLIYSLENAPAGATLTGARFSWQTGENDGGQHALTLVASDGKLQASKTVTLNVRVPVMDTCTKIVLLRPTAGETFKVGDTMRIKWVADYQKLRGVRVMISPDNGINFSPVDSINDLHLLGEFNADEIYIGNLGTYTWVVPESIVWEEQLISLISNKVIMQMYADYNPNECTGEQYITVNMDGTLTITR
jgi:hypothetical protein